MTKLTTPVTRETATFERTNPIIVTLHPRHIELRLKTQRKSVTVDYGTLLDFARKLAYMRALVGKVGKR